MPGTVTLAAFLGLAATCGDGIAPQTLADLTRHESGFNSIAINVNGPGGGTVRGITSKAQAIAKARALIRQGKNFDAGVAQINSRNFAWLGLTPETAFDPCANIRAQAALLKSYSRYNTGSETRGFANGYVAGVVEKSRAAASVSRETAAQTLPASSVPACPGAPPAWDAFGRARHSIECLAKHGNAIGRNISVSVEEYP